MLLYSIIDLCIINILNRNNDWETAAIATALRRYGRRVQFIDHRVGGFAKLTPCIRVAAFTLQDRARLDRGSSGQRYICSSVAFFNIARIGILGVNPIGCIVHHIGAEGAIVEGAGIAHIHRQLTDEFCAAGNAELHQRSGHFLEPSDDKVIALELLSVRGRDNDSVSLASEIRIRRDCHVRQFSSLNRSIVTAYGLVGRSIHQLPFANIPTEYKARFAAIALLQGNLGDRLLGEQNLLVAGVYFHIAVRHGKGRFSLGRICEGHTGGLRMPLGEHHIVGGAIIRLHGNGFPGDCRGGICRAEAVYNLDAVRHFFSWEVNKNTKYVCQAAKAVCFPEIAAGDRHIYISQRRTISRKTNTFVCLKDIHYRIILISVIRCVFVFNLIRRFIQALINNKIS